MLSIYNEITEDGTFYNFDGELIRQNLPSGYIVAIGAQDEENYPANGSTVGRWTDTDTGIVYWDRVEWVADRLTAGNLARQRGELAIWDCLNNKEFRV